LNKIQQDITSKVDNVYIFYLIVLIDMDKVSDNVVAFSDNFLNPGQSKTVGADNKIQLFLNFIK
jgi:hypothetical protein